MNYTEPRYTTDIDLWVDGSPENAARVFQALMRFDARLSGLKAADFSMPGMVSQMGGPPVRVTSLSGLDFPDCWERHMTGRFGKREVPVISGWKKPGKRAATNIRKANAV